MFVYDNTTVLNTGTARGAPQRRRAAYYFTATNIITAKYEGDPTYTSVSTTVGYTTSGAIAQPLASASSLPRSPRWKPRLDCDHYPGPYEPPVHRAQRSVAFYDGTHSCIVAVDTTKTAT